MVPQVFAQLTFVAPVLAICPWLGPEAGDPTEVEPLSPTGEDPWEARVKTFIFRAILTFIFPWVVGGSKDLGLV